MNKFGWGFEPLFPVTWILVAALFSFLLLTWFELKKTQKHIAYRIAALFFMIGSIVGLMLQPSFRSFQKENALLLTPGYDRQKLDSVLNLYPDSKVLRTLSASPFPNSHDFNAENSTRQRVNYIFGQGLADFVLDEIRPSGFVFLPSPLPNGFVEMNIPEIVSGRFNTLSGVFNAPRVTKLKLVGPAGVEDSTVVDPTRKNFSLSLTPRQSGQFIYQLISEDSLGTKTAERLPVDVTSAAKLRVLFLQDFPSSEFRHLKNFLTEAGHSLAVRTRTSKNIFAEEFVNTQQMQLKSLNAELLTSFDLLMTDSKTFDGLLSPEKSNVERAVHDGLGLIVVQDTPSKKKDFYSIGGKGISIDTAHFQIQNKGYVLPALPYDITPTDDLVPILKNKKRILAGYRLWGAGKIGFQLLQETFRIKLAGNGFDYATFWSTFLESVSRKKQKNFGLKINTRFPYYPDEPIHFEVVAAQGVPVVLSEGVRIPLLEDVIINDYWHGKTWGGNPGWHQLSLGDSSKIHYFVHENSEWMSLRAANSMKQTRIAQNQEPSIPSSPPEHKPVSPVVFYLIFLFAGGFLWLMPKI